MEMNKKMLEELRVLANIQDENIDYSDIPEITSLAGWEPNPFFKPVKAPISAKLDKDVIAWLKIHGSVSKFLNQICREKMQEERQELAQAM
jgi:uncharacterized protein (DUF4415 family)